MKIVLKDLNFDEILQVVDLLKYLDDDRVDINAQRIIYKTFYETEFLVKFDWSSWDKGRKIINDNEAIGKTDMLTLRMLITAIIRNDRFNEGAFERSLENGVVKQILLRLKKLSDEL